jgi:nucleotide-binding universal stress UspA family protein
MFRKILVAFDGSEGSRKALRAGIELAKRLEVDLHSISVVEGLPYFAATVGEVEELKDDVEIFFKKITKEAWDEAALEGVNLHTTVLPGHEVETIIKYTREGRFDLLIVGFSGYSNVFGRIMGGTAQNLTRLSPCAVMIAKEPSV